MTRVIAADGASIFLEISNLDRQMVLHVALFRFLRNYEDFQSGPSQNSTAVAFVQQADPTDEKESRQVHAGRKR